MFSFRTREEKALKDLYKSFFDIIKDLEKIRNPTFDYDSTARIIQEKSITLAENDLQILADTITSILLKLEPIVKTTEKSKTVTNLIEKYSNYNTKNLAVPSNSKIICMRYTINGTTRIYTKESINALLDTNETKLNKTRLANLNKFFITDEFFNIPYILRHYSQHSYHKNIIEGLNKLKLLHYKHYVIKKFTKKVFQEKLDQIIFEHQFFKIPYWKKEDLNIISNLVLETMSVKSTEHSIFTQSILLTFLGNRDYTFQYSDALFNNEEDSNNGLFNPEFCLRYYVF